MESTPKARRPNFQPYVPVHRRNQQERSNSAPASPIASRPVSKEESDVKRRGRGQFRAPTVEEVKQTEAKPDNGVHEVVSQLEKLETKEDEKEDWEEEWESEELNTKSPPSNKKKELKQSSSTPTFDDDSTTVLDCYDFPSSFKTHHLQDLFKEFESMKGGYNIKWMDDTRALLVFNHPQTARSAFIAHVNNPLIKIRPYKGQIEQKPSGPVPKRPVTTDMVARRLVHGALGVRSIKTPEQRQAEKDLIRAAKEKRQAEKANNALRAQQIANAFDE